MRQTFDKKRGRGKRLNENVTKAQILLYITEHPDTPQSNIRKEVETTLNITTRKPIDKQLSILEEEGIVVKTQQFKGDKGYYENCFNVNKSFKAFKTTYDLLKKQGFTTKFLQSPYTNDYTSSDEFPAIISVHVCKEIIPRLFDRFKNADNYNELMEESKDLLQNEDMKARKELLDQILQNDKSNFVSGITIEFLDSLKQHSVDELYDSMDILKPGTLEKMGDLEMFSMILIINVFMDILVPSDETELIVKMIKSSPSAIDYLLSLENTNPLIFNQILMKYIGYRYGQENIIGESPITVILKSAFIQDFVSGKVIYSKELDSVLDQIFTPKPKVSEAST